MANDLTRNTSLIYDDVRICKSKKKEDALKASTQVWQKGVRIYVRYGNVGYNKVTDGISTFSILPEIGGGTPGGDNASTLNGQNGAYYRARANHTGTQAISTVSGLQGALDGKATAAQGALADTAVQPGDLPATPTWTTISGKPVFVAEGANAAAARTALGLGTAATTASTAYATAAQGALANTALQSYTETDPTVPAHVKSIQTTDITSWNAKQSALSIPTQSEVETGTATTARSITAQRIRQGAYAAKAAREWHGTRAAYEEIVTKDPNIDYFIEKE